MLYKTWEMRAWLGNYNNFPFAIWRTLVISDDRGKIWHLKGTGCLQSYELFHVQVSQSRHSTYTARPLSIQSVLEGKIGLPSVPCSGSMLAAHSIDAMAMNKELFARYIPRHMWRPKPWLTLIFWMKNVYMLTIWYVSLSMGIRRDDSISVLIEELLGAKFFIIRRDIRIPKEWIKGINIW